MASTVTSVISGSLAARLRAAPARFRSKPMIRGATTVAPNMASTCCRPSAMVPGQGKRSSGAIKPVRFSAHESMNPGSPFVRLLGRLSYAAAPQPGQMSLFGRLDSMAMPHPLRFGLKLSGQDTTIQDLRAVWRIADEARFDHLWDFDHLAAIGQGGPDRPIFEGWSLLAAMAEATSHVRIGAMVTGNTYRNPALLAKIAVTVDHLSNGRLEFGIGAAWAEVEHSMYGIEGLEHRVGRLSESLQILRSLWTQDRRTFEGRYSRV